jgi:hypothetical protein
MPSFPTDIAVSNNDDVHVVNWDLSPEYYKKSDGSFGSVTQLSDTKEGNDTGISVDTDDQNAHHVSFGNEDTDQSVHAFGSFSATWSRASDADEDDEVTASIVTFVREGDTYADLGFILVTNDPIVVGTDSQNWEFYSGTSAVLAGDGLTKTPTTLNMIPEDASIESLADGIRVQIDQHYTEVSLEKVAEGLRVGTASAGKILIGQDTGSSEKTSFESISGDMLLEATGRAVVQTAASIIENADDTGGGLKLSKAEPGKVIVGKGTSGGDPEPEYVTITGDISVDENGNVSVDGSFLRNSDVRFRETFQTDGTTSTFTISSSPLSESNTQADYKELVFLNGVLQVEGASEDYTKPTATDISFNDTPLDGGNVSVMYVSS